MSFKSFLALLVVALIAPQATFGLLGITINILLGGNPPPPPTTPPQEVSPCGLLKGVTEYYLMNSDGRYAVLDKNKQLVFLKNVGTGLASRFSVVQKSCNVYGICSDGVCMNRCSQCTSDTEDTKTVKFNVNNADNTNSQWMLTSPNGASNGLLILKTLSYSEYVTYKKTPNNDDQLTITTNLTLVSQFVFLQPADCGLLKDGKEYRMMNIQGQYGVVDELTNFVYMKQVPQASGTKFTVVQKSCNVYGFCVFGFCLQRCDGVCDDDIKNLLYISGNSDDVWAQFELVYFDPTAPFYFIKSKDYNGFMTYSNTSYGDGHVTLSDLLYDGSKFSLMEVV